MVGVVAHVVNDGAVAALYHTRWKLLVEDTPTEQLRQAAAGGERPAADVHFFPQSDHRQLHAWAAQMQRQPCCITQAFGVSEQLIQALKAAPPAALKAAPPAAADNWVLLDKRPYPISTFLSWATLPHNQVVSQCLVFEDPRVVSLLLVSSLSLTLMTREWHPYCRDRSTGAALLNWCC